MNADQIQRKELADFLKTRRQRISPQEAGLTPDSSRRRTPGLRREELAVLAGISLPWYMSLEQGRDIRVSDQVLDSLARVLKLDAAERRHLFLLARKTIPASINASDSLAVPPSLKLHLEQLEPCPAYIHDERWDVLDWNHAAARLFGDYGSMATEERNTVWLMFTRPEYRERLVKWEEMAQSIIAQFRVSFANHVHDPWYRSMADRLKASSPDFRTWWSRHEVQAQPDDLKVYRHPEVGLLTLHTDSFTWHARDRKLYLKSMMPVPGTDTMDKLKTLSRYRSDYAASNG